MSTHNLINIMVTSAVFAFVLSMLFRFKPSWSFISGGLGSLIGLAGAYAVSTLFATTNDAYILVAMAVAVIVQLVITKLAIRKATINDGAHSAIPRTVLDGQTNARKTENQGSAATQKDERSSRTKRIFLSYRRKDSQDIIGRIYDRLVRDFGDDAVFKDVDSIPLGVDFRTHIAMQLENCEYFLAVIGKDWLRITGEDGMRRIEDAKDHVRLETQVALKKGIPVIPVLVRGAQVPAAADLPGDLQDLSFRNGLSVRPDPDFHRDMDRLVSQIKK